MGVATPVFGHVQYQVVTASTKDRAAGKDLEAERCWLSVSLQCRIDGTLELAQEVETKEHRQESRLGGEKRPQAEVIGPQLVSQVRLCGTPRPLGHCNRARFPELHRRDWSQRPETHNRATR